MKRFDEELNKLQIEYGFGERSSISDEETEMYKNHTKEGKDLPKDIFRTYINNKETFQKIVRYDISIEEKIEYLMLKQTSCIQIIKYCTIFVTVVVLIWLFVICHSLL